MDKNVLLNEFKKCSFSFLKKEDVEKVEEVVLYFLKKENPNDEEKRAFKETVNKMLTVQKEREAKELLKEIEKFKEILKRLENKIEKNVVERTKENLFKIEEKINKHKECKERLIKKIDELIRS